TNYLKQFYHLEIIYQLTLGGIDNLELIIINKPIEYMDFIIIKELFISTLNIYKNSQNILLQQPFYDFIRNKTSINQSFQLIEDIYRQESKIFQSFCKLTKEQVKNTYEQLVNSNDFQLILNQNKRADQQWQITGQNFVELRSKHRKSTRGVWGTLGHGLLSIGGKLMSPFLSNSTQSTLNDIDKFFAYVLQDTLLLMQSEQIGNNQIFTRAHSEELEKLIHLHKRYKISLNLRELNESLFPKSNQIYRFEINCYNHQLHKILILFWISNTEQPFLFLPINLTERYTKFYLIINTPVTHLAIETDFCAGNHEKWSKLVDHREKYRIKDIVELKCEKISTNYCYTVNSIADTLSPTMIPSRSQILQNLQDLEEQLENQITHSKEGDLFRKSLITPAFQLVTKNLNEIIQIIQCPNLHENDLLNTTNIYQLFMKFPRSDVLIKALNLLRNETFSSISSTIQFVDDNDPALRITSFDLVWTHSMKNAFTLSRQCLIDGNTQMNIFINHLRQMKSYLILAYAWANSLSENSSSNIQQEFSSMLNEYNQIPKLSNQENIEYLNECQSIINDAQRIYRTIKRTSNNWMEIKRLLNLTTFSIEPNLNKAFSHSHMSRDAHLWLIETKTNDNTLIKLESHPQPAILDFGITLAHIQQKLIQRIFIHNQSDRDLFLCIDRPTNDNPIFDVTNENIQLASSDTYQFDILLKSPTTIGFTNENWNLLIDKNYTITNAIQLQTQTVEIDVELSSDKIDFGLIPCNNHQIEKSIFFKNVLPCSVRVKAQIQSTETNRYQSNLIILNNELEIPAESTISFNIALESSENIEEDIDVDICLAINTAKNFKLFKVLGYQGRIIMDNNQSNRLLIPDFYKNEKRRIPIEFQNTGQIEYTLRLHSPTLKLITNDIHMPVNEKKTINIEIQMNNNTHQEFILNIDFINNKRQCQLIFVCETSFANITYSIRNGDDKQIINISEKAHMEQIWNRNTSQLNPIEHEITFKNSGKAAAIINFNEIVSKKNPSSPLTSHFHIEPDHFFVLPQSTVPVRFIYHPIDLRIFDAEVKLQSNSSTTLLAIPFHVEFQTPILRSTPRTLIDIGSIQSGQIFKQNVLMLKNTGQKKLRFTISESILKQPFVKLATLQGSLTQTQLTSVNQSFPIIPNQTHSFSVKIECDTIDNHNFQSEILELAQIELTSLCDPIIDTDGKLINRPITIIIIGHTIPFATFALPSNSNCQIWSALNLLPSLWLYRICREHSIHSSYAPLVALTAIAHICGSDKTKSSLPETQDDWSTFCFNLSQGKTEKVILKSFNDGNTLNNSIDTLSTHLRSSFTNYRSFFYHSQLFHRSFMNIDSIRLQLLSVINSADDIDEAYSMQNYVSKFWNIFEQCTPDDAYQQAINLIHFCVSNDCAMPKNVRVFSDLIHQIIHSSTTFNVAQQLSTLIPSTGTFGELLTISTTSSDLKWTLLFGLINDQIKQIMIRLIKNDYQALLDLHLIYFKQHQSISIQRSMLEAFKNANHLWNTLDSKQKSDLLSPLFVDNIDLVQIIQGVSEKKQAELNHLILVTNIILKRFNISQSLLNQIENIFKRTTSYDISTALGTYFNMSYQQRESLAYKIYLFKTSLVDYGNKNRSIEKLNIEPYCDIIRQLVPLSSDQWNSAKKAIAMLGQLLCDADNKNTIVAVTVGQSLHLLNVLNPDKNWSSIKGSYVQICSTPTWETISDFINTIGCNQEIIQLTKTFQDNNNEETIAETVLKLCRLVSTNDQINLLSTHESSIRNLQITTTSPVELLTQIQSFVSPEIKNKINAYLTLLRLSPQNLLAVDDYNRYLLFDNIVPSWLTLFNITCPKFQRLFEALSSILTSFPGLITARGIPLCQQLYTTSISSALCTLANCRQNTREGFIDTSSSIPTTSSPSILETIHQTLKQHISQNDPPKSTINIPAPTTSSPPPPTTTATTTSTPCPYSEETLKKMETSVSHYLKNNVRQSVRFDETDTIRDIVKAALDYRPQVAQWYAIFATFNVLMHHRSNATDPNQIADGHKIVQYGLQLLRDIIVAKKILEPTFAYTGVRFLVKDLTQLEKCLLSLALENYPLLLNTLRQLNVDTTQLQQDFKPPSRSIGSNNGISKKTKLELIQEIGMTSDPTELNTTTEPTVTSNDDIPLTMDDWENAMQKTDDQQLEDIMKITKHKTKNKSKKRKVHNSGSSIQTNVGNLASAMLAQNTNKMKASSASDTTGTGDIPVDDTDGSQQVDIDLKMMAMHEHLRKQPNLIDMYEKANTKVVSTLPEGKLDNRSALKSNTKPDQWTYQLLVETPAIARMIDTILQEFRLNWEKLINNVNLLDRHEIRWCIMIDNSGSMSIHRTIIYETLVVIMELLRKLETRFAVARFGTRKNQKILKNLHELFTNQDGQYVLEALTFDEGTYPATGLARVADQVFPKGKDSITSSNTIVHRLVLMITDGLTEERDGGSYSRTITKNDIKLGFMFIETAEQSSSQVLLKGLGQAQHCVLKTDDIKELPIKVPELMYQMIKACLTTSSSTTTAATSKSIFPIINIKMPNKIEESNTEKLKYDAENQSSYTISSPTATIPKLTEVKSQLMNYLSRSDEYTNYASKAIDELRQYYHKLEITSKMQDIEKNWIADEFAFSSLIDDLTVAFGDVVFPYNKFTRRRAALRGSSLYLPGLIKAMTTEWSYKKIFSAKLAGGKREHAVCLVIDVSTSMFGTLSSGIMDGIIVLIGALKKLNLDNCGIIIFGREVRLIKTNEQSWDTGCISTLINELRFDQDDDTQDADAIEVAIDLLNQCSVRGEKKIFILTDGYTNCASHITMVQQRAEDNGIDLVAIAIGIDQTNLKSVYKRYIQCATPYGLPKAIRSLFENEPQLCSLEWLIKKDIGNTSNTILKQSLFEDLQSKKVFNDMIKDLAGQRELMLMNSGQPPSNITVNICFCLDCTGSMSRWLSAAKEQMKNIIDGITKLIQKEYPSLNLKLCFAIVAYRDINNRPQFFLQDFTDNTTEVINFLNRLTAGGGDDLPEDVLGALDQCLNLNWSKTNARFIVLITDAPGHGPELNDNLAIDNYPQGNGKHTVQSICDRLLTEDKEIDLMFCRIKPKATAKMEAAFTKYYNAKKDETGKVFTSIQLFDEKQQESQSFHFVFVLDESGSMSPHWSSLKTAYSGFLTQRNDDQGGDDLFTVVLFNNNARPIYQRQRLVNTHNLPMLEAGGTTYSAGLKVAEQSIAADGTASSVVMIFMSDGANCGGEDPVTLIRQLKQKYGGNHNFICHTVGFGPGVAPGSAEAKLLANMASTGGGQTYSAKDAGQLKSVFGNIAANSTTSDKLVQRFSEILAREISVKIMVDYL
ncbi:unnamed protein product, partial [Rotaria sp. Silwood2]